MKAITTQIRETLKANLPSALQVDWMSTYVSGGMVQRWRPCNDDQWWARFGGIPFLARLNPQTGVREFNQLTNQELLPAHAQGNNRADEIVDLVCDEIAAGRLSIEHEMDDETADRLGALVHEQWREMGAPTRRGKDKSFDENDVAWEVLKTLPNAAFLVDLDVRRVKATVKMLRVLLKK